MSTKSIFAAAAVAIVVGSGLPVREASAGVRPYAFAEGVDSLPELSLELENWFGVSKPREGGKSSWDWWIGPVAGITDQLEVGLFAIFRQAGSSAGEAAPEDGGLQMSSLRLQVSYLLAPKAEWPVDVRVRAELGQPMGAEHFSVWAAVIVSKDLGPLNLTGSFNPWLAISKEEVEPYLDGCFGLSLETLSWLRVGAEFWSSWEPGELQSTVGPSVALATGRVWLTTNVGVGLTDDTATLRGRIILGVLF